MSTTDRPSSRIQAPSLARKPRKSRGKGLRATTGCKVCRKRHIKCDEVKPTCGPCGKSDRACEYDTASASSGPANIRRDTTSTSVEVNQPPSSSESAYSWPRQEVRSAGPQQDDHDYATETTPTRWFGLLSTNTADVDLDMDSHCSTGGAVGASASNGRPDVMQVSTIAPSTSHDELQERVSWQAQECLQLRGLEFDMYKYFVKSVSAWIDMFDPAQHFASTVPRLALYNEGLMKAILAIGARHLAVKASEGSCDTVVFQHAAVQYYAETLQYLQSAMRYASYKNSQELLATTLIISAYEMLDGSGKGWERHLKGVFWIQRTRELNGESGGLEQAVWWAWIHQDCWASFRERRRCFSFFKPTRPYSNMSAWDKASRIVYILAQCVNYISEEEKRNGERELADRASRADELLEILKEWDANKDISFDPLPLAERPTFSSKALWIHPPAFAVSVQMYHVCRILLLSHRPNSEDRRGERLKRDDEIAESIDVVAGLATQLMEEPAWTYSIEYLHMAGLFCLDEDRQRAILNILEANEARSDGHRSAEHAAELSAAWSKDTIVQSHEY